MIALPFPQKSAVPMVLQARFTAPLGLNGYDFGALDPVDLVNVSSGYFYRILSYSFACEVPETAYQGAILQTPSFNLTTTGNQTQILAKPVPLPQYCKDVRFLQYFAVPDDATQVTAKLYGRLSGAAVDLLGYPTITGVLSLFVQSLGDSDWCERYNNGEI